MSGLRPLCQPFCTETVKLRVGRRTGDRTGRAADLGPDGEAASTAVESWVGRHGRVDGRPTQLLYQGRRPQGRGGHGRPASRPIGGSRGQRHDHKARAHPGLRCVGVLVGGSRRLPPPPTQQCRRVRWPVVQEGGTQPPERVQCNVSVLGSGHGLAQESFERSAGDWHDCRVQRVGAPSQVEPAADHARRRSCNLRMERL